MGTVIIGKKGASSTLVTTANATAPIPHLVPGSPPTPSPMPNMANGTTAAGAPATVLMENGHPIVASPTCTFAVSQGSEPGSLGAVACPAAIPPSQAAAVPVASPTVLAAGFAVASDSMTATMAGMPGVGTPAGGAGTLLSPAAPPPAQKDDESWDPQSFALKYKLQWPLAGKKTVPGDWFSFMPDFLKSKDLGGKPFTIKLYGVVSLGAKFQWKTKSKWKALLKKYNFPTKFLSAHIPGLSGNTGINIKTAGQSETGYAHDLMWSFWKGDPSHDDAQSIWTFITMKGGFRFSVMGAGLFNSFIQKQMSWKDQEDAQKKLQKEGTPVFRIECCGQAQFDVEGWLKANHPKSKLLGKVDQVQIDIAFRLISINSRIPVSDKPYDPASGLSLFAVAEAEDGIFSPPKVQFAMNFNHEFEVPEEMINSMGDWFPDKVEGSIGLGFLVEADLNYEWLVRQGLRKAFNAWLKEAEAQVAEVLEPVLASIGEAVGVVSIEAVGTVASIAVMAIAIVFIAYEGFKALGDSEEQINIQENFAIYRDGFLWAFEQAVCNNPAAATVDVGAARGFIANALNVEPQNQGAIHYIASLFDSNKAGVDWGYDSKGKVDGLAFGNAYYKKLQSSVISTIQAQTPTASADDITNKLNLLLVPGGPLFPKIFAQNHNNIVGQIRHDFYKGYWMSHTAHSWVGQVFGDTGWMIRDAVFRSLFVNIVNMENYNQPPGAISKDILDMAIVDAWYLHVKTSTWAKQDPIPNDKQTDPSTVRENQAGMDSMGPQPDTTDYQHSGAGGEHHQSRGQVRPSLLGYISEDLLGTLTDADYVVVGGQQIPWPQAASNCYTKEIKFPDQKMHLVRMNRWYEDNNIPYGWPIFIMELSQWGAFGGVNY